MRNGMFEERKGAANEDIELGYRLGQKGLEIIYNPRALAWHYHVETLKGACRRAYERGKNFDLLSENIPPKIIFPLYHLLSIEAGLVCYMKMLPRELARTIIFNGLTVNKFWRPILEQSENKAWIARIFANGITYRGVIYYYLRAGLRDKGELKYFGGKQELIYKGYFDDVDMSMMFHSLDMNGKSALVGPASNGFIGKKVKFIGKESHAGSAPHEGVNALNAAMLAINNIHAQRETFKDTDRVRVHPIITKGGDIVNSVPADVRMESYVRARTIEGMLDSNLKVDRALRAGAMAVGASVEITSIPGYLPILRTPQLDEIFKENLIFMGINPENIVEGGDFTGSFDFGDVSHLMPTIHPMVGGIQGNLHTREYKITDEELAYIIPAKAMALTIIDLLYDDAKKAKSILEGFTPKMTKEEYLKFMDDRDNIELFK